MAVILEVNDGISTRRSLKPRQGAGGFWAPWWGPWQDADPHPGAARAVRAISAKITKLNTDENSPIAQKSASARSTLILFADGNEAERMIGVQPENGLSQKLK